MEVHSMVRIAFSIGGLLLFLLIELAGPYRQPTVSKSKRWFINLGMTIFNNILLFIPAGFLLGAASYADKQGFGVLNMIDLPWFFKMLITVIFMDFMLYVWHLLNHEVPLLWRFHRVHHCDLNMDVSTATRFHFGELFISIIIKASLIYYLGADVLGVLIFETALLLSAQFHHSSMRIPWGFEKKWWLLFVPPSMHRIHHSVRMKERDSNYGTIFSIWDRIFGTMVSDTDQDLIKIGVGGHFKEEKLNLQHLLVMPFTSRVR